jgi:predicted MFS family arabinose efflux permease
MGRKRSPTSVLIVTTFSHFMQHIYVGSSILLPLIVKDLKLSYTEFGLAVALSSLIGGLSQIVFSIASRRIARHILLGLGNLMLSLGTFLTGLSSKFIDFLSARVISNLGVAPQHPMGTAIISEKFDEKSLGTAIGFHYGLAYIGNIIGPVLMTILSLTLGWRSTLFIFSIPALAAGLIVIWYLSEDKKTRKIMVEKDVDESHLKSDIAVLIKTRGVLPILLTQALLSGGLDIGTLTTYTPIFLASFLGMDAYERGMVYTVGLLGGVIGPILLGKYAGCIGYVKMAATSTFISSILIYSLVFYKPGASNILLALHLFAIMFVSFSLPTLLQSYLVKVTSGYNQDLSVGIFFTMGFIFNSLWVGIIGNLLDVYASFNPAIAIMGTLGLIALIVLISQLIKKTVE